MGECVETHFGERSSFQAFFKLLRYALGLLMFMLPWAIKFGGIIYGPIILALLIVINSYRSHVLSKTAAEITSNGIPSPTGYSDWWVLENSLGKVEKTSANCFLALFSAVQWISLLGHASTYLAFAGINLNQVFPLFDRPELVGERTWIAICTGIVVVAHPLSQWFRNRVQEPCLRSGCPTVCSVFVLQMIPVILSVTCGLVIVTEYVAGEAKKNSPLSPSTEADLLNIPLLLAAVVFVVGATPDDVTSSYGSLGERGKYPSLLIASGSVTLVITVGFTIAVFLGLGEFICGSVTYNLPFTETRYLAVRTLLSISAIIFVSIRHHVEPHLASRLSVAEITCDIIFKMIFLVVAGAVALGLPSFHGLACVFGSVTSFMLTFIFPFLCDLSLHVTGGRSTSYDDDSTAEATLLTRSSSQGQDEKPSLSVMRILRDVIFIVLGIAGMVSGLIATAHYIDVKGNHSAASNCTMHEVTGP